LPSSNNSQFSKIYFQSAGSGAEIYFDFLSNNLTCEQKLSYSGYATNPIQTGGYYDNYTLSLSVRINNNNYTSE